MRQPARNKAQGRQQTAKTVSYQAPVGGWNAIDALADMKPTEAIVLDNFYPMPGWVEIRGGSVEHATGMTGTGKTLVVYQGLSGNPKMFCCTSFGVYDVSSAGAVGSSVATITNGKFQHIMFGDGTNNYLILCNGTDKPQYFDGSTWTAVDGSSSPALTGVTTTQLIAPVMHKGRLMFIQKASMSFWYLAAGAAGGALTEFDLSGVAQKGGYLMAAESWTVDAGNGPDDRMVFITSEGEVIVYQGTDPSSASSWALVGVYTLSEPLGRKCILKYGAELVILTRQGAYPLSTVWNAAGFDYTKSATRKIQNEFNASALSYGDNFGWKAISYPDKNAVIVNIPLAEDGVHYQYVFNTISNAWCRFTGWHAEDLTVFNNNLYYCEGASVIKAWSGSSDKGSNIEAYAKTSFSYFGSRGQQKQFKMFRPSISANGNINYLADMDVDFADNGIIGSAPLTPFAGATWDADNWDEATWKGGFNTINNWVTPSVSAGYCASTKIKISTNSVNAKLNSIDYVMELGGVL